MSREENLKNLLSDAVDLVHKILVEKSVSEDLRLELLRWREDAEIALGNVIP